jgi:hypothetical protein
VRLPALDVLHADDRAVGVREELLRLGFRDDLRELAVGVLHHLLERLHERVGDREPGEALFASVRAGVGVAAWGGEGGNERGECVRVRSFGVVSLQIVPVARFILFFEPEKRARVKKRRRISRVRGRARGARGVSRTELGDERQVELELVLEPVHGAAASLRENLRRARREGERRGTDLVGDVSGESPRERVTIKYRDAAADDRRAFASGTVCAGGVVCPTPAAPFKQSCSNLSAES